MARYKWWLAGGVGAAAVAVAAAFIFRKEIGVLASKVASTVVAVGKDGAFAAVLPKGVSSYATQILNASRKYGVSPWIIAGVMYRESSGGLSLKPQGPAGTGDFLKRPAGRQYRQPSGTLYTIGSTGLPEDGFGFGRGLMQIDFAVHNQWVTSNNWRDPQTNIDYATSLIAQQQKFFAQSAGTPVWIEQWRYRGLYSADGKGIVEGWTSKYGAKPPTFCKNVGTTERPKAVCGPLPDPRPLSGGKLIEATLASYNAGAGGVLQALAAGLPASAATAGNDYADWVISRVASWASRFS